MPEAPHETATPWSVYCLDDGETYWIAAPNEETAKRHAREEWSVGEGWTDKDAEWEREVTCVAVSGSLTFTEDERGDAEGMERVRAMHAKLREASVWQNSACSACEFDGAAVCAHVSRAPKVTAPADAWAEWARELTLAAPEPWNAAMLLGSTAW